ncbi:hypothetical protein B0H14DRAFT_3480890 [Mycena olivaceomarginata]|nr:hypothetical protein B0H14DRAFT_3480890 [Mycena olivaceomarginata]
MPIMRGATLPKGKLDEPFIGVMRIVDQDSWRNPTLQEMGLRVGFGHGGGTCPRPRAERLEAVTVTGIKTVTVDFCTCPGAGSDDDQIKAHRWWPLGSNFVSVMTVEMLDTLVSHGEEDTGDAAELDGSDSGSGEESNSDKESDAGTDSPKSLSRSHPDDGHDLMRGVHGYWVERGRDIIGCLDLETRRCAEAVPARDDDGNRIGTCERLRHAHETTPESNNTPGTSALPIKVSSSPPASPEVEVVRWTRVAGSTAWALNPVPYSISRFGARVRLRPCVSPEHLFLTAARPPDCVVLEAHHMCGICCGVKEHPVSHCFVCIPSSPVSRVEVRLVPRISPKRTLACSVAMGPGRAQLQHCSHVTKDYHVGLGLRFRLNAPSPARRRASPVQPPGDVASVVRVSSDRRRVLEEVVPVENFPQTTPAHFEEDFATNTGLDAADFGYMMGDTSLEAEEQAPEDDSISNMNCLGKISAYHFLRLLELLTNADGLHPPLDRRWAFMYIVHQHRMMTRMKRSGRGHSDDGVGGTAQGELVLACRACSQPGRNLPDGWDKINWAEMPEDLRYKFFLFLAEDTNYWLINHDVSSEAWDPIIDDGLGYFCNREEYKKHLQNHVDEDEMSSCSGFQAMFLANAKRVKGLRTTGVGGVTCARHNMWRPNSIGDLQRGECYSNIDFILFSAILNQEFLGTYARFTDPEKVSVWFKVPNFHILSHKWPYHSPFSFHWMWGAGVTDGEDIEQNWEFTNGAAGSTKMMGPGGRHTFLEGLFAFHNWMRMVSYRKVFGRRLARDLKEGKQHKDTFDVFTALIEAERPDLVEKWRKWVLTWESEQHTDGYTSLFEMAKPVNTMTEIRVRLGKEELTRTGAGVRGRTTAYIEHVHFDGAGSGGKPTSRLWRNPTPLQELDFVKRKTALLKLYQPFPEVTTYLYARTELRAASCAKTCEKGLDKLEEEMREGEMMVTLEELRQALRLRTGDEPFPPPQYDGPTGVDARTGVKLRYRYARNMYLRRRGHGDWEKLYHTLEEADVRGINECAVTEEEEGEKECLRELGAIMEGGIAVAGVVAAGDKTHTMLWIWYSTNLTNGEEDLIDALRVEWCKVYARMRRWHEDVVLVEEEMRRTIEFGGWMVAQWEVSTSARTQGVDLALAEGLRVYSLKHISHEEKMCTMLVSQWAGLCEKAQVYMAGVTVDRRTEVVLDAEDEDLDNPKGDVEGDEPVDDGGDEYQEGGDNV